ncbi:hypothetical protein [Bordetella genomosp. 11]|nr:hypothetical protein [Bordetella genomosp. 11]
MDAETETMMKSIVLKIACAVSLAALAGCHTMDQLKKSGDAASNGDYGEAGVALLLTPITLILDVFTLGGSVDPETGASALGSYAESKGYAPAGSTATALRQSRANMAAIESITGDSSSSTSLTTASSTASSSEAEEQEETDGTAQAVLASTTRSYNGTCQVTTVFLANRIPEVNNTQIRQIRDIAVNTNIVDGMHEANRQGYTPEAAIKASLAQAKEFDATTAQALQSASAVDAFGTTDEEFLAVLKNGKLSLEDCGAIRNASLCAAAATKIGAIFNRAVAGEMMCHLRAGTWPGRATRS